MGASGFFMAGCQNLCHRIFRNHLSGIATGTFGSTSPERPSTLPGLRAVVEATDAWYLAFVSAIVDEIPASARARAAHPP